MKRRQKQLLALSRVRAQIEAAEAETLGGLRFFYDESDHAPAEPAVTIRIADAKALLKATYKEVCR